MSTLAVSLLCLSLNVYHEAAGEPELGQMAVAFVTLTRAKERHQTICQTVFEPMQFSWANDLSEEEQLTIPPDSPEWKQAQRVARLAYRNHGLDFTLGANLYHAIYVQPKWANHATYLLQVGQHIFYREVR